MKRYIKSESDFDSTDIVIKAIECVNDFDRDWELDNPDDFADAVFDWLEDHGYELTDEIVDRVWDEVGSTDFER